MKIEIRYEDAQAVVLLDGEHIEDHLTQQGCEVDFFVDFDGRPRPLVTLTFAPDELVAELQDPAIDADEAEREVLDGEVVEDRDVTEGLPDGAFDMTHADEPIALGKETS